MYFYERYVSFSKIRRKCFQIKILPTSSNQQSDNNLFSLVIDGVQIFPLLCFVSLKKKPIFRQFESEFNRNENLCSTSWVIKNNKNILKWYNVARIQTVIFLKIRL